MHRIPILTTGAGFIRYMIRDKMCLLDSTPEVWQEKVKTIYHDKKTLHAMSRYSKKRYPKFSEKVAQKMFQTVVTRCVEHVMLFVPWADQGLGIQGRNYARWLSHFNISVFIFSYCPYGFPSARHMQRNPQEWEGYTVYYSKNDREHVTDEEVLEFISEHRITKCILPETCWFRVFEISSLLKSSGVKVYAIPNVEIVRRGELFQHAVFYKLLCNNSLCEGVFRRHGFTNVEKIGYSTAYLDPKPKSYLHNLKFLCLGGMNSITRKQLDKVYEAFCLATATVGSYISLTLTMQNLSQELPFKNENPNVVLLTKHLSYQAILELYATSHIVIQVSKYEGLGLGFYEALACGTPVLTLDTSPHNEIIKNEYNGWCIPCYSGPMEENDDSLVTAALFDPSLLARKIVEIVGMGSEYIRSIAKNAKSDPHFGNRFIRSLDL